MITKNKQHEHAKYNINYHIILSTKYRKNFLKDQIAVDIKNSMIRASENQKWSISIQEIDSVKPNHIHLLINAHPSIAPYEIISRLKQFSTYDLWKHHNIEMKKFYWSEKHYCWTRGYFCSSIGDASIETIYNYINTQG
jgi:putative transposase